jgi:hypothetical protein
VEANEEIRERRLVNRSGGTRLDPGYVHRMSAIFEPPAIPHAVLRNDYDGDTDIIAQASSILDAPARRA